MDGFTVQCSCEYKSSAVCKAYMSKNPVLAANIEVANMSGEEQDASQQGTNDVVRNYHDSQYQEVWLQDTRMFVGKRI